MLEANGKPTAAAAAAVTSPRSARSAVASGRRSTLDVGSSLKFTPITVCWRDLSYYVTVPKGLTGAAALNVMPADAEEELAGKKRLLNNVTGARHRGYCSIYHPTISCNNSCLCTAKSTSLHIC